MNDFCRRHNLPVPVVGRPPRSARRGESCPHHLGWATFIKIEEKKAENVRRWRYQYDLVARWEYSAAPTTREIKVNDRMIVALWAEIMVGGPSTTALYGTYQNERVVVWRAPNHY